VRVTLLTADSSGGMGHYARNLASALSAHAVVDVALYARAHEPMPDWSDTNLLRLSLSASRLRYRLLEKFNPRFYRAVAGRFADHGTEIVHVTGGLIGLRSLAAGLKEQGIACVCTVHDPVPHEESATIWGQVYERYSRRYELPAAFEAVDAVHVHSQRHAELMAALFGSAVRAKCYVVHHGAGLTPEIATGSSRPSELDRLWPGKPTLLFFGRVEPYKGVDLLLAGAERLAQSGLQFNLLIAGAGSTPDIALPRDRVNLLRIDRFILDGEIRSLFEASDVVLLPYRDATQSGVVPLAYAFGRPVIATRVGALDEVVKDGETGFLVPTSDPDAIAHAVHRLFSDERVAPRLGRWARDFAEQYLSWSSAAAQHFGRYTQLRSIGG